MAVENTPNKSSHPNFYHDNDVSPFACFSYTLVLGTGRQKLKLEIRDRDMIVCVTVTETTLRLLHLQNVREDTVKKSQAAIERLLDELKLYDDSSDTSRTRGGFIEREHGIDYLHEDVCRFVETQAEKRDLDVDWELEGYSRDMLRILCNQTYSTVRWLKDATWEMGGGEVICLEPRKVPRVSGGEEWKFDD